MFYRNKDSFYTRKTIFNILNICFSTTATSPALQFGDFVLGLSATHKSAKELVFRRILLFDLSEVIALFPFAPGYAIRMDKAFARWLSMQKNLPCRA